MNTRVGLFLAVFVTAFFATASAQEKDDLGGVDIKALHVEMEDAVGNYTVINERMDETATAAVLFGVAGAVVNSAQNNAQDNETADIWRGTAEGLEIGALIEAALLAKLTSSNSVSLTDDANAASHKLVIDLQDWGLTRRSKDSEELRAFINVNVKVLDEKDRTIWRDYPNRVGKFSSTNTLDFTDEVFASELEELARKTGESIAYGIIYR
ncbi:hypothetical protein FF098_005195 [Parvularcula flava]|uniref:Uncharacterized protein n=1 Tax=Aquisalinus luteolus TaxID=1566827 RepID=A0A8J3A650_9PROT|nr:hypothetical protein [Aquisalinus luteolus]NHK27293.1 hypothetical protein [Aquisalinus luteolus]GGH94996.1 hypothetical protein GCM10011355_10490 [Aquisalinus luteolus]